MGYKHLNYQLIWNVIFIHDTQLKIINYKEVISLFGKTGKNKVSLLNIL